jgi:enoyl-CoA hydratase
VRNTAIDEEVVRVESRGAILVITIDRPDARNALNLAVAQGLAAAFARLDEDDALRAAVLTGSGQGFCSGMDLAEFTENGRTTSDLLRSVMRSGTAKPMIAAIEGFAVAGGLELALTCDLIVASRGSRFALPEVRRSLVANGGGLIRLAHRIPFHVAAELGLTGNFVAAERLYDVGLINRLTDPNAALAVAVDLACEIGDHAPLAVATTKRILALDDEEGWHRQDELADPVFDSDDAREGARAFLERRSPRPDSR